MPTNRSAASRFEQTLLASIGTYALVVLRDERTLTVNSPDDPDKQRASRELQGAAAAAPVAKTGGYTWSCGGMSATGCGMSGTGCGVHGIIG